MADKSDDEAPDLGDTAAPDLGGSFDEDDVRTVSGAPREPLISGDPLGLGKTTDPDAPSHRPRPKIVSLLIEFFSMSRTTAILLVAFVLFGGLYLIVKQDPVVGIGTPPAPPTTTENGPAEPTEPTPDEDTPTEDPLTEDPTPTPTTPTTSPQVTVTPPPAQEAPTDTPDQQAPQQGETQPQAPQQQAPQQQAPGEQAPQQQSPQN